MSLEPQTATQPSRIRLIALDLDDTLLGRDGRIHPADLAALHAARRRGVRLVVATGRTWAACREYVAQLGPDVPAITTGGALVQDPDGRLLESWRLPAEVAREAVAWADAHGVPVRVDLDDAFLFNRHPGSDFWNPDSPPYQLRPFERVVDGLARSLDRDPFQVVAVGRATVRGLLRAFGHLEGEIRLLALPDRDDPTVLHITHRLATKGLALAWLCERLGIPREATMAFGDGINDLPMLSFAGVAVAPEHGVPAARFLADDVLRGPGGFAEVLRRHGVISEEDAAGAEGRAAEADVDGRAAEADGRAAD
ncbi:MAG: HAD-IIB family hydrolase [Firmicutes bacterium]|nr:HAD-IIB family hydrolase [Bacillota bacterium]